MTMALQINVNRQPEDDLVKVHVSGELDMEAAPELDECLKTQMADCDRLVLDLGGVTFLGASGLSVLLAASEQARTHQVHWGLVVSGHAVSRPLRVVGLREELPIHPSVATATQAVKAA